MGWRDRVEIREVGSEKRVEIKGDGGRDKRGNENKERERELEGERRERKEEENIM